MGTDDKAKDAGGEGRAGSAGGPQPHPGRDDECRCREVSQMTPRQLLGLMIRDLVFWKKRGTK